MGCNNQWTLSLQDHLSRLWRDSHLFLHLASVWRRVDSAAMSDSLFNNSFKSPIAAGGEPVSNEQHETPLDHRVTEAHVSHHHFVYVPHYLSDCLVSSASAGGVLFTVHFQPLISSDHATLLAPVFLRAVATLYLHHARRHEMDWLWEINLCQSQGYDTRQCAFKCCVIFVENVRSLWSTEGNLHLCLA